MSEAGKTSARNPRRILLVIHSLSLGGAQRVLTRLANHCACKGLAVTVCTFTGDEAPPFFQLAPSVKVEPLGIALSSTSKIRALTNNLLRIWALRGAIKRQQPDVIVSFLTKVNVVTLLASIGLGVPVAVSERTDPVHWRQGMIWKTLRRVSYPIADRVAVQSRRAREFYLGFVEEKKVVVVPNPVAPPRIAPEPDRLARNKMVISVGRLVIEKRFDLLVDAFAQVSERFPEWRLTVVGDGPCRSDLEQRIAGYGLHGRIQLPGGTSDVEESLRKASIFVCSSDIEGFPMALCEAMAGGLAVISTRFHDDVEEIVQDGINGCVVESNSARALSETLALLMSRYSLRRRLGAQAMKIVGRFADNEVMARWEEVLQGLVVL